MSMQTLFVEACIDGNVEWMLHALKQLKKNGEVKNGKIIVPIRLAYRHQNRTRNAALGHHANRMFHLSQRIPDDAIAYGRSYKVKHSVGIDLMNTALRMNPSIRRRYLQQLLSLEMVDVNRPYRHRHFDTLYGGKPAQLCYSKCSYQPIHQALLSYASDLVSEMFKAGATIQELLVCVGKCNGWCLQSSPILHLKSAVLTDDGGTHQEQIQNMLDVLATGGVDFNPATCERLKKNEEGEVIARSPTSLLNIMLKPELWLHRFELISSLVSNGLTNLTLHSLKGVSLMRLEEFLRHLNPVIANKFQRRRETSANIIFWYLHSFGYEFDYSGQFRFESFADLLADQNYIPPPFAYTPKDVIEMEKVHLTVMQQSREPLTLMEASRRSTRLAVGGVHFRERVGRLPIPARLKNWLISANGLTRPEGCADDSHSMF